MTPELDAWKSRLAGSRHGKEALSALAKALEAHADPTRVTQTALLYCYQASRYDESADVGRWLVDSEQQFIDTEAEQLLSAARALLGKFHRDFPEDTTGFGVICRLSGQEQRNLVEGLLKVEQAMTQTVGLQGTAPAAPWFHVLGGIRYPKPVHDQSVIADCATALGLGLTELFRQEAGRPNYQLAALLIRATTGDDLCDNGGRPLKGRIESFLHRNPGATFAGFHCHPR